MRAQLPAPLVWGQDRHWNPPLRSCRVPVQVKTVHRDAVQPQTLPRGLAAGSPAPRCSRGQASGGIRADNLHIATSCQDFAELPTRTASSPAPSIQSFPAELTRPFEPLISFLFLRSSQRSRQEPQVLFILFPCQLQSAAESISHLYFGPYFAPSLHTVTPIQGLLTDDCGFSLLAVLSTTRRQINFQKSLL